MELLGVKSLTQLARIARAPENHDIFPKPFNYVRRGDPVYDVEDVKRYITERKARGLEQ